MMYQVRRSPENQNDRHIKNQETIKTKSSEGRIEKQAQLQLKRHRENFDEGDGPIPQSKKAKFFHSGIEKHHVPNMIRDLAPVIELQRDDAFQLGVKAANQYQMEVLNGLGVEMQEKCESAQVVLKKYQSKEIENIAKKKNQKIGTQLFDLYQILECQNQTKRQHGKTILEYAKQIINLIPDDDSIDSDENEIEASQEYKEMAEKYLENLSFDLPGLSINKLAAVLQNAMNGQESDDEGTISELSERDQEIELALRRLGNLLLVSQHNIALAAKCINPQNFDKSLDNISKCVSEIIKDAARRIEEHKNEHHRAAIQSEEEAAFHKMSIEMAKVLLLDSGNINFGIIETVTETLIPEQLKNTVAVDNLWLVLEDLATNPTIWEQIANVKPPSHKKIPSDPAIRACFELNSDQEITKRDAQLFVLSALLGHLRQAKAGTCFATACLIKAKYYHTLFFVQDLADMTEKGYVTRSLFKENRDFPFQARVTKEYLDVEITANKKGQITSTKRYDLIPDKAQEWPHPKKGTNLFEAPGIVASCQAMGISNVKEAVLTVLKEMPEKFSADEILKQLANHAYLRQESTLYWLRSQQRLSLEEYHYKAQFAFGAQTNHPLHRAYEQVSTSMVNYFGAQYMWPAWIALTMEEILVKSIKGLPLSSQTKYKKLIQESFLPMITRMRYRYNPNFDNVKKLFDDGNYGIRESHFYGYQLCDTGLPKDFKYSTNLYKNYQNHGSYITLEKFQEYQPPHLWKSVETEEKFREFLDDVIFETVNHIKEDLISSADKNQWDEVAKVMRENVSNPTFTKKMIFRLFGKTSDQEKEYKKNEFNVQSTPWQFAWGGDFNEVLKTYFGFSEEPSKLKDYNGTPKEVLVKCINYIKKQPDEFKEQYDDPRNQIVVSSPVHVFLLRPFEPSFKEAWDSDILANEYVKNNVEKPGLEVSNSRLNMRARNEIISFVANNMWVTRYCEKEDWVRQQLTNDSKKIFDQMILDAPKIYQMTVLDFQKEVEKIVISSRAGDKNIGKRNAPWEQQFKIILGNFVKKLVSSEDDRTKKIDKSTADKLLDFARNRVDSIALSEQASKKFLELMKQVPSGLSVKEFRKAVVKSAYTARCEYLYCNDPGWKTSFCEYLDTKLFTALPKKSQEKLISSGIITHDTNWKEQVHDIHFIFLVNPGTGNIELTRFHPDTQVVGFMDQSDWFPKKSKGHGCWKFPDNYRSWSDAPLFNVKKYMDV